MSGVGLAVVVGVEIDHVAAEGSAVEHAAKEPEHERQAAAFVFPHRQQQAFAGAVGIGDRPPPSRH